MLLHRLQVEGVDNAHIKGEIESQWTGSIASGVMSDCQQKPKTQKDLGTRPPMDRRPSDGQEVLAGPILGFWIRERDSNAQSVSAARARPPSSIASSLHRLPDVHITSMARTLRTARKSTGAARRFGPFVPPQPEPEVQPEVETEESEEESEVESEEEPQEEEPQEEDPLQPEEQAPQEDLEDDEVVVISDDEPEAEEGNDAGDASAGAEGAEGGGTPPLQWIDVKHFHNGLHLSFPRMLNGAIQELGYNNLEISYKVVESVHPEFPPRFCASACFMVDNPEHRGTTLSEEHYSVSYHSDQDAAINDAARQAYGVFCEDHRTAFGQSARRYLPCRKSGETRHQISSLEHEGNTQLASLVEFTAALSTEHDALLGAHRSLHLECESLRAQLLRATHVTHIEPAQSPPRKKPRYGEPSGATTVLPHDH
ncbi:hypothetical protein BS78_K004100 [Paspalum vaginatum]|uniref:Uncharacterized protein n=1 Tax=Paspalum vaginatum TaxID=158149 RepID=A0A9W7XDH8_9POAL|nr:hypothetical protein BS78_K004100 [Paspalum vaginatum]